MRRISELTVSQSKWRGLPSRQKQQGTCSPSPFFPGILVSNVNREMRPARRQIYPTPPPRINAPNAAVPARNSRSSMYSSFVCACRMLPGPNATAGVPCAAKIFASQNQSAAAHPRPADRNRRAHGSVFSVTNAGPSRCKLTWARGACRATNALIRRRTSAAEHPGCTRISTQILHSAGTRFNSPPPCKIPRFRLHPPNTGCRCAASHGASSSFSACTSGSAR